jgi:hypothetical protein
MPSCSSFVIPSRSSFVIPSRSPLVIPSRSALLSFRAVPPSCHSEPKARNLSARCAEIPRFARDDNGGTSESLSLCRAERSHALSFQPVPPSCHSEPKARNLSARCAEIPRFARDDSAGTFPPTPFATERRLLECHSAPLVLGQPCQPSLVPPSRSSLVIPSRRRGISASRRGEIPRFARDDNGGTSESLFLCRAERSHALSFRAFLPVVMPIRLTLCHSEPFPFCHSEPKARNLSARCAEIPRFARDDSGGGSGLAARLA